MTAGARPTPYEEALAHATGAGHAIAFRFGRTAIAAVLEAAGLRPGDEVLLSPLTCRVVPLAILAAGLVPRYADPGPDRLNLDRAAASRRVTPATRAVLFQRTYGTAAGADEVAAWAAERDLLFVEDCAQCLPSPEAWIGGRTAGPAAAIFSNNAGKPLPAASGGVAVTHGAELATRTRAIADRLPTTPIGTAVRSQLANRLRNAWLTSRRYWPAFDLTRRVSASYAERSLVDEIREEITAVAGRPRPLERRAGLRWLAERTAVADHREACVRHYAAALLTRGASTPRPEGPLYYCPVQVPDKPGLLAAARRQRIEIVPWPISTPIYPVEHPDQLAAYGYQVGDCPGAEAVAGRLVGLPTHPLIGKADRDRTIALVDRHLGGTTR